MKNITPEGLVVLDIKEILTIHAMHKRFDWWRMSVSGKLRGRGILTKNTDMAGWSDFFVLPYPDYALPFFLEAKKPGGLQSHSQKLFQSRVETRGYKYYLVESGVEVENLLKEKSLIP